MKQLCYKSCFHRTQARHLLLAFTLPALADNASPLYQYQTKATVARYEGGLTQVGRAVAPHPGRASAALPQREVTDPVECATDYAWCPTNPAIGCDTSPTWCFQTDPITCQTNIEWCQTNPAWGLAARTGPLAAGRTGGADPPLRG